MHDFDRNQYLIGLTLIEGVGPVLAKRMIAYCGGPQEVFRESAHKLALVPGVKNLRARISTGAKDALLRAEQDLEFCLKHGINMYTYFDDLYPRRLSNCDDGPVFLFCKGGADLNAARMVSIVGTRNPTPYGKEFTEKLVEELGACDISIVSGMAYGIDIAAHKTCLEYGIPTIGVVAHGLDRMYPPVHKTTAKNMVQQQGALVSEFLTGTTPDKENFPKRNRIVAGMCDATIVIETDMKGGSMITARLANDYNRDVFALPGKPIDEKSRGCNFMIKTNRAALFDSAQDIIETMGWERANNGAAQTQTSLFHDLSTEERDLTDLLRDKGKLMVDLISLELARPVSEVNVTLLNLEFKGAVRSLPGKAYELV